MSFNKGDLVKHKKDGGLYPVMNRSNKYYGFYEVVQMLGKFHQDKWNMHEDALVKA